MQKRVAISIKLPPDLLDEVEAARQTLPVVPTKTACHEIALREWVKSVRQHKGRK